MPTIDSREIVDKIIKHNGHYDDDPVVIAVHQYENQSGGVSYHLAYSEQEIINLFTSPYCHKIKRLWP